MRGDPNFFNKNPVEKKLCAFFVSIKDQTQNINANSNI